VAPAGSLLAVSTLLVGLLSGCGLLSGGSASGTDPSASRAGATATATTTAGASATDVSPTSSATPSPAPSPTLGRTGSRGRNGSGLTAADRKAGLGTRVVASRGTGRLRVVRGSATAPGRGPVVRVRVEVEGGLDVDGAVFAAFLMDTLNHDRGWSHGGARRFARTDGRAAIRVVLASPQTSAGICRPLITYGRLSCRIGDAAVLTLYRWVRAIPEYGRDRTGYRRYVLNHEVGHLLGHSHRSCPGEGRRAPVMMQQTKGLLGCLPNPWPYP
jgi:hypothetical protein